MPDPNNRTGRDFSLYDAMDDEQLRQILRDDASKPEGEDTDMELILHIMEVLAKRRKEANENIPPEQALEQFNKKYTYFDNSLISEEKPAKKKTIGFHRWQRWVATLAAMLILVFGSALTAQAFGFDIFEIIAKWTKETFHLSSVDNQSGSVSPDTEDSKYTKLGEALGEYDINISLVPAWLPNGYTEEDVRIQDTPKRRIFTAQFLNGTEAIQIRISEHLDSYPVLVEQSDSLLELYTHNGVNYYILENMSQIQIVYINDRFECVISGSFTLDEARKIIDSI